ncbi:MAG: 7-carboxy-7-deazaguanine synthase QueE [Gammaproteobacteria bacterium]|nr:7-carboxy-7-deazaguanine synthase QueE [Gammaproteobacteria bacterium]MDH3768561.1 7-carboxy-7-deazaguanine synthase QueE [Gammaproteobacteria bacterium]
MNAPSKDDLPVDQRLKVTEIFHSLQGEAEASGIPTVFVRLTGCPLRCQYCDTPYAFFGGEWMHFDDVLGQVEQYSVSHVCVTGGEPLAQRNCLGMLVCLCDAGYEVSIETSGAYDIGELDQRVTRVVDIKTPGSLEVERNRLENIPLLRHTDQVKFVVCDRTDYDWACEFVKTHDLRSRCQVYFSPSYDQLAARELADWILADGVDVRLQIQLHKLLWGDKPGH